MKKRLLLIPLIALLLLTACGGGDSTTAPDTTDAPSSVTLPDNTLPAEGVFAVSRTGNTVTVSVSLAEAKNSMVSLLLLTDPSYLYTWSEDPTTRLADLGQLTLDAEGKGSITLISEADTVYAVLTAKTGCYIGEVK